MNTLSDKETTSYVRLPKKPGHVFSLGDTVGWESGSAGTWIVGHIVEAVAPGDRPSASIKVLTLRAHESYVVEGRLYSRGVTHNAPMLFWPRVGGLFPVEKLP